MLQTLDTVWSSVPFFEAFASQLLSLTKKVPLKEDEKLSTQPKMQEQKGHSFPNLSLLLGY